MTVLGDTYTFIDWAKEHDQNGKPVRVINMLAKRMPMLQHLLWKEANMADGHKVVVQAGLPAAVWRAIGQATPASKGTTHELKFPTRHAATRSVIDITLAALGKGVAHNRMAKADSHMETIKQTVQQRFVYGANDGTGIAGLTHYYGALTGSASSRNTISAGGSTGNQTSAFLIDSGEGKICGIHPPGLPAGVEHIDLGNGGFIMEPDPINGGTYPAYADEWRFHCGLAIENWTAGGRVCNIDVSDLDDRTSGYLERVVHSMTELHYNVSSGAHGSNAFWEVPTKVAVALHNAAVARTMNGTLSIEQFGGRPVTHFIGNPVRVNDSILITETAVS